MTTGKILVLLDANKAKAAFLAPLFTALAAAAASYIISGDWNDTEIRTAAGGAVLSLASSLATYLTPAGVGTIDVRPPGPQPGTTFIGSERGYSIFEVLAALFVALLIVIVLLALLDRL
jgi:hypothetical protein